MVQSSDSEDTYSGPDVEFEDAAEFKMTKERADRYMADDDDLVITPAEEVERPDVSRR
jgi:hypothetical protein